MVCKTIQHKAVFDELKSNGIYVVNEHKCGQSGYDKEYKFMMSHYGYEHRPIFLVPICYRADFSGADITDDSVLMTFSIPDSSLRIQDFYEWSDFIMFNENPDSFMEYTSYKSIEQYGRFVLDEYKSFGLCRDVVYQATTDRLMLDWLVSVDKVTRKFIADYVEVGGINLLF